MQGTLLSASNMVYGVWEATGTGGATVPIPGVGNVAVTNGFPTAASIQTVLQTTPAAAGFKVAGGVWTMTGAPTPATCTFTYNASAGVGQAPTITAVNTAGC
jgi:MSHA pilin protein MshA